MQILLNSLYFISDYGSSTVTFITSAPPVEGNGYSVICQVSQVLPGVDVFWTTSDGRRVELPQQGKQPLGFEGEEHVVKMGFEK